MKHSCALILLLSAFINTALSQSQKEISIVRNFSQMVPINKVWRLIKDRETTVLFYPFKEYSMCDAAVKSSPGLICCIVTGRFPDEKQIPINFSSIQHVGAPHNLLYKIIPSNETITFYSGENVRVNNCLQSIVLIESVATKEDIAEERRLEMEEDQKKGQIQNEVFPTIDNINANIISASIQMLFDEAIKDPFKYSTAKASSDTVYAYYDVNGEGKLKKVNPVNGKQYSLADSSDLRKNQINLYDTPQYEGDPKISLLFSLIFDANGKLIVPDKISVISFRRERQQDRSIELVGLLAFELPLNDSIKNQFAQVRLQNNSLTGSLKLPFELSYGSHISNKYDNETNGQAIKRGDKIDISPARYFKDDQEKEHLISILKEQTEILDYKRGDFNFIIGTKSFYRTIGFNILENNLIANRISNKSTQSFSINKDMVKSFSGEGKKINK